MAAPTLLGAPRAAATHEFKVRLARGKDKALGLDLQTREGCFLKVQSVQETGALADWNSQRVPSRRLVAGDLIVDVNGLRGSTPAALEQLESAQQLEVTVRRRGSKAAALAKLRPDEAQGGFCEELVLEVLADGLDGDDPDDDV
eukprot:CAMPEP_0168477996 /NCGR_PEP_ID=MMETSP0228-20121227/62711_1 /TAXON_ID=133427 /ORGANISM="Protoceratium reticulatum, Strain CCCM 535 (=CCMP 1889)" /LENGTH=143 /DNA_ID=CAMNT_0008494205 /DNA_START=18 /DNA_END=445 /DNA_ORIENTATION=+